MIDPNCTDFTKFVKGLDIAYSNLSYPIVSLGRCINMTESDRSLKDLKSPEMLPSDARKRPVVVADEGGEGM